MKCEDFKERILEALYDELSGKDLEEFSNHVMSCSKCAGLYSGMKTALHILERRQIPEMDPSFSAEFWDRIEPSLTSQETGRIHPLFTRRLSVIPSWAYGIAAVFLIAVGIYFGRTYFAPRPASLPDLRIVSIANDTTTTQALAYLQRSKNFLLGVVNAPPDEEPVLDPDRSRQLVDQANVLYTALNRPDQEQMRRLIDDLRIILLQLSNIEVRPGVPAVEMVQRSIDRKSIFLKINIEELRAMAGKPTENI